MHQETKSKLNKVQITLLADQAKKFKKSQAEMEKLKGYIRDDVLQSISRNTEKLVKKLKKQEQAMDETNQVVMRKYDVGVQMVKKTGKWTESDWNISQL